jgi:hypothetical protein
LILHESASADPSHAAVEIPGGLAWLRLITLGGQAWTNTRKSSWPIGIAAVGYRHYRYASLAFVNGVEGAGFAAPSRPELLKGRV